MPGGRDPVRGGVRATGDGRGTLLPVAAEGTGAVKGVRGGDGGGIIGGAQDGTTWASGRGEMELENLGNGVRATDAPHGLPRQGRPVGLPGGGMPRMSGDKDSDAGTFYAPTCTGHRGHFGGGKHPPPMVPPMRYAGPLAYTEQNAPCHHTVRQGSGEEEAAVSGVRIKGYHGEGL